MRKKAHSHLKDDLLAFDKVNSLSFKKKIYEYKTLSSNYF